MKKHHAGVTVSRAAAPLANLSGNDQWTTLRTAKLFGWILLGLVITSVAWAVYILAARPQASTTLGTMIADE